MEKIVVIDATYAKDYDSVYHPSMGWVRARVKMRKRDVFRNMIQQHPSKGKKK